MTTTQQTSFEQTLEQFLQSDDFRTGVIASTKASWGGSGYSVELFPDGRWSVLWNNQIGNLYEAAGIILRLPVLDDSEYQECMSNGMDEEEFFDLAFANEEEELAQSLRDALAE